MTTHHTGWMHFHYSLTVMRRMHCFIDKINLYTFFLKKKKVNTHKRQLQFVCQFTNNQFLKHFLPYQIWL